METVVKNIFLLALYVVSLLIYVFLIAEIIPKRFLKVSGDSNYTLGRGLKKFVYPDGRAVVYEPHPSIRKYIKKYALFTLDGYKYVQLSMDMIVKNYSAQITMFDNQNKIIDSLHVSEYTLASRTPCPIKLHENTSYIAITLLEVNRISQNKVNCGYIRKSGVLLYILSVFAATLFQIIYTFTTLNRLFGIFNADVLSGGMYLFLIISALVIGIVCFVITVFSKMENGVKVVFK